MVAPNSLLVPALVVVVVAPNRPPAAGVVVPAVAPNRLVPPDDVVVAGVILLNSDILAACYVCKARSNEGERGMRRDGERMS